MIRSSMIHGDWRTRVEMCGARPARRVASHGSWAVGMRWMLLAIAAFGSPVWAGDFQIRSTQALLTRNAQDQQFVQGQAQSAQTLARIEESRRLNQQSYVRLPIAPRVDLVPREEHAGSARTQTYAQELDQFAGRLRELETQRRALVQTQSARRTQRTQED